MKAKTLKMWVNENVSDWFLDGFSGKNARILDLILTKIDLMPDESEVSEEFLVSLVKDILLGGSPEFLSLIQETFSYSSFSVWANAILELKPYRELYDNFTRFFRFTNHQVNFLYQYLRLAKLNQVVLNQTVLDLFIKVVKNDLQDCTDDEKVNFFKYTKINEFIDYCTGKNLSEMGFLWHHGLAKKELIEKITPLKRYQQKYLFEHLHHLAKVNLLTEESFNEAVRQFSKERLPIPLVTVKKISRKEKKFPRSYLDCQSLKVFIDSKPQKNYPKGSYGIIKPCFALEGNKPIAALKRFIPDATLDFQQAKRECWQHAKREARYEQRMGREGFCFNRNGKFYLIRSWFSGKSLNTVLAERLVQIPSSIRLQCLLTALRDLQRLHSKHLIHGDVSEANCILDEAQASMRLMDFGNAHRNPHKERYLATRQYCDPYRLSTDFPDDIYAFGHIVGKLFPPNIDRLTTLTDHAIHCLIDSMMALKREQRCLVEDAIAFVEGFLKGVTDENELQQLCLRTLKRENNTVDAVLKGRYILKM